MSTCHHMNIVAQTKIGDAYSPNGKIESIKILWKDYKSYSHELRTSEITVFSILPILCLDFDNK